MKFFRNRYDDIRFIFNYGYEVSIPNGFIYHEDGILTLTTIHKEYIDWLQENKTGNYSYMIDYIHTSAIFTFSRKSDALLFKLTFYGADTNLKTIKY
jgi:hypothetical protein